jgi:serralysin
MRWRGFVNESLYSGDGSDTLFGNPDIDRAIGGTRSDHILGGIGWEMLSGALGADVFIYQSLADRKATLACDIITDFNPAEQDKIDLRLTNANAAILSNQMFHSIVQAYFSNTVGGMRVSHSTSQTLILIDTNGDSQAEMTITKTCHINLTAADFIL